LREKSEEEEEKKKRRSLDHPWTEKKEEGKGRKKVVTKPQQGRQKGGSAGVESDVDVKLEKKDSTQGRGGDSKSLGKV